MSLLVVDQLVCHAVGDYVIQSDWMANEKTKQSTAALAHAFSYTVPFLLLSQSPRALAIVMITHFVIDRWRLARYVCWLKNFLSPRYTFIPDPKGRWHQKPTVGLVSCPVDQNTGEYLCTDHPELRAERITWWHPWAECVGTGYHKDRPAWMAVWLMIICDNLMHVLCNALALKYF